MGGLNGWTVAGLSLATWCAVLGPVFAFHALRGRFRAPAQAVPQVQYHGEH